MPRTLILTATITPPSGVPSLVRTDPALRLRDYLAAFEFYLKVPTAILPRIVFAENSGSDVDPVSGLSPTGSAATRRSSSPATRGSTIPPPTGVGTAR